jgi:hypothetical protein
MSNCFDLWHDDVFVDAAELYLRVQKKCSKVVALIGGEMRAACFHSWEQHSKKMSKSRRFLQKVVRAPMVQGWENWVAWMCEEGPWWEPGRELQEQLDAKCGHVLALISGDVLRHALLEWANMCRRNKRALRRWKQQSEHHMIVLWKDFAAQERDWKRIIVTIRRARSLHLRWEALVDWLFIAQERRYNRSLVGDACLLWVNTAVIRAFRALDELCQEQKYYRRVVADFRRRFELRPAARCLGTMRPSRLAHPPCPAPLARVACRLGARNGHRSSRRRYAPAWAGSGQEAARGVMWSGCAALRSFAVGVYTAADVLLIWVAHVHRFPVGVRAAADAHAAADASDQAPSHCRVSHKMEQCRPGRAHRPPGADVCKVTDAHAVRPTFSKRQRRRA